jgi:hypothetical protein
LLDILYELLLMKKKVGQHPKVLENIKQNIAAAEKERRELRFFYNLNELEKGKIQVLKNDEFIAGLESYLLAHPYENIDEKTELLFRLSKVALEDEIPLRERALALLSSASKFHLEKNEKEIILVLIYGLCNWLEFETEFLPGFSVLNKRLRDMLVWCLNNGYWVEVEEVAILLHRIQSGSLEKNKAIKSLVSKTLQTLEKKAIVERLTDEYLRQNQQQPLIQNILHCIGNKAVIYLLNRVIHSHSRMERLALRNLIPTFGAIAVPALKDCLKGKPPWSVVRNVIYMVSEIGVDENYSLVERYFSYPDERVQHEMIGCVLKLGGPQMKPRLIEGLSLVHDRLKTYIIPLIVEQTQNDANVVAAVLALAQQRKTFTGQSRHELLQVIIAALRTMVCQESVVLLEEMRDEYTDQERAGQLVLHIDEALKVIKPRLRHNLQNVDHYKDVASFDNDPVEQQLAFDKVRRTEEEVQTLVRAGKLQQAGLLVYNQAVAAAQAKDFSTAGLLRDRLLEINPNALEEVIQLGEFIDDQKDTSITSHHLEIWSELYEEMTTEEFNELYYSLRQENYHKGEVIVQSGETDSSLYFLNSGYISLSCVVAGKEVFLKRMQPSNVLGGDQFFSPSVWTVTLRALCEIQVHVLDHDVLKKIAREHPGIEEKLQNYCSKHAQVEELLKMSGDDRREYPRHSVILSTRNILMDPFGNMGKRNINGELLDISKQGLAFTIRITNIDNARLLLGRYIMTTILLGDEELPQLNGVIVGVRLHESRKNDFSVHVRLNQKIDDASFRRILLASAGGKRLTF